MMVGARTTSSPPFRGGRSKSNKYPGRGASESERKRERDVRVSHRRPSKTYVSISLNRCSRAYYDSKDGWQKKSERKKKKKKGEYVFNSGRFIQQARTISRVIINMGGCGWLPAVYDHHCVYTTVGIVNDALFQCLIQTKFLFLRCHYYIITYALLLLYHLRSLYYYVVYRTMT